MVLIKNGEKPLAIHCFRSNMLIEQLGYYAYAERCGQTDGFALFSLKHVEQPLIVQAKMPNKIETPLLL